LHYTLLRNGENAKNVKYGSILVLAQPLTFYLYGVLNVVFYRFSVVISPILAAITIIILFLGITLLFSKIYDKGNRVVKESRYEGLAWYKILNWLLVLVYFFGSLIFFSYCMMKFNTTRPGM